MAGPVAAGAGDTMTAPRAYCQILRNRLPEVTLRGALNPEPFPELGAGPTGILVAGTDEAGQYESAAVFASTDPDERASWFRSMAAHGWRPGKPASMVPAAFASLVVRFVLDPDYVSATWAERKLRGDITPGLAREVENLARNQLACDPAKWRFGAEPIPKSAWIGAQLWDGTAWLDVDAETLIHYSFSDDNVNFAWGVEALTKAYAGKEILPWPKYS